MAPVHIALNCFKTVRYLILQHTLEKQMSLLPPCYRGETGTEIFRDIPNVNGIHAVIEQDELTPLKMARVCHGSPFLQE